MSRIKVVERRVRTSDRRRQTVAPRYPFRDSNDALISSDRRTLPDRRVNNIQVEWGEEIELITGA